MSDIVGAWETPRNEGTAIFRVGVTPYYAGTNHIESSKMWKVGKIKQVGDQVEGWWVQIYDEDGILRISMPCSNVALEFSGGRP